MKTIIIILILTLSIQASLNRKVGNMKYKLTNSFKWQKTKPLNNGQNRWFGYSNNGNAIIELIGKENNLNKVTFVIQPTTSNTINTQNIFYAVRFVRNAMPKWGSNAKAWLNTNIAHVANTGESRAGTLNGRTITVSRLEKLNWIEIVIE
jgi:hypothetical protein